MPLFTRGAAAAPALGLALAISAIAPGTAQAQGLPLADPPELFGSPQFTGLAPSLTAGGGRATSAGHTAESALDGPLGAGYAASSPQHAILGGSAVFAPDGLGNAGPIVTAVLPRAVRASGEAVTIYGAGLTGLGPGGLTFAGVPAASVSTISDRELSAFTPNLTNAFGNPLAAVDVAVQSGPSEAALGDGVISTPAYLQTSPARLDSTFTVTHIGAPGGIGIPSWAAPIPGVVVPLSGIGGAVELAQIFFTYPGETLDADGVSSTVYPIPDKPTLVGQTIYFQSIVVETFVPTVASFTNTVAVEILP